MTLLPPGKIYMNWTWCEREPHRDVLLLLLDKSVKIFSPEHQVTFSPVRDLLLKDIQASLFSPQTSFRYTPPGICSLMPSLSDFDDQQVYLRSEITLWVRHGNAGIQSFCWNSTHSYSSNLIKFLSQDASIMDVCSSLSTLTQLCFPVSTICAQQPSHPIYPSVSCSSWSRIIMESEMESLTTELCNLGLELLSYLFGAITGVNPQSSSQSHHKSLAPTSAKTFVRLFSKWSFSKLEDCSPLVFSLQKKSSQISSCPWPWEIFSTCPPTVRREFYHQNSSLWEVLSSWLQSQWIQLLSLPLVILCNGPFGTGRYNETHSSETRGLGAFNVTI